MVFARVLLFLRRASLDWTRSNSEYDIRVTVNSEVICETDVRKGEAMKSLDETGTVVATHAPATCTLHLDVQPSRNPAAPAVGGAAGSTRSLLPDPPA